MQQVAEHQARVELSQKRRNFQEFARTPEAEVEEHNLHDKIIEACCRNYWYFVRSRMDKRTTTAKGVPDFIIQANGRTFWIECKSKTGKQTTDQVIAQHMIECNGGKYAVVRSMDEFWKVINEK